MCSRLDDTDSYKITFTSIEPLKAKYWLGSPYEPEFVKVKFDGNVRWDHMARVVTFCEMDIDELRDINYHIIF